MNNLKRWECDYSDHKIEVFNLVQTINAISLPLIVAVESTNKATSTLLAARTYHEHHL